MLRSRIIPCLLFHDSGLVKSTKFSDYKYVGDPLNAVRIFNEKESDELIFLDIDASKQSIDPDFEMIEKIASECRMPLCVGGGINSLEHAIKIFKLGVEKIALGESIIFDHNLIKLISKEVGNQSVVTILNVKKNLFGKYKVTKSHGKQITKINPSNLAKQYEDAGAGEILINDVDNDGMMSGYNEDLFDEIRSQVSIPITFLGGAGSDEDFKKMVKRFGVLGLAAGSYFVFKGKLKAVLISYPDNDLKKQICNANYE